LHDLEILAQAPHLKRAKYTDYLRRHWLVPGLWIFVALIAPAVLAQPLQKTVAMVGARSGASWPLWIAKEAGLYAKYGLESNWFTRFIQGRLLRLSADTPR
jgi:hypothetical protein